ncbi:MAG: type II secretion system protein [Aureliella sp.]
MIAFLGDLYSLRPSSYKRRAATLVSVLIVLMIVGLLSAQAVQMMVAIRQADVKRAQLLQAREFIELGRMVAAQQGSEQSEEREFEISLSRGDKAKVMIIQDTDPIHSARLRIEIKYLVRGGSEVSATWQSSNEEVVK